MNEDFNISTQPANLRDILLYQRIVTMGRMNFAIAEIDVDVPVNGSYATWISLIASKIIIATIGKNELCHRGNCETIMIVMKQL